MGNDKSQRTTKELTRSVAGRLDAGIQQGLIRVGIILIGVVVLIALVIHYLMSPSPLTQPSASFVVWEDNSTLAGSVLTATGVVTNTHSEQSMDNVNIEVKAIDEADRIIETYYISVMPSLILPEAEGIYSGTLQLPRFCVSVDLNILWDWVPP